MYFRRAFLQVETAKWLEHHFGSESTRSSTGNLSDEEEDNDRGGRQKTTSNSFINVTMKSAETSPPPANGYFKGVSEWKTKDPAPVRPPVRRKREQRKTEIVRTTSAANELESSPLFNSVQQRVQGYEMTKEKLSGRNAINGYTQSHHNGYVQVRCPLGTAHSFTCRGNTHLVKIRVHIDSHFKNVSYINRSNILLACTNG